jgi:hypothetical protein
MEKHPDTLLGRQSAARPRRVTALLRKTIFLSGLVGFVALVAALAFAASQE